MALREIGVAMIGAGFMGWVHVEALRRAGVRVVGILGSTPEKSREAAERLGLPQGYPDLAALLADSQVQAVHIGTPNKLHFEQTRAALAAGKHVMCEKPLAMTSQESGELVRLAQEYPKLATGVNYNIRYYPLCLEAAARVRGGELGEVLHVTGSYVQDWLLLPTDYNWRVLSSEGGELRAVADIGTHWLDLIHAITGLEVEALCADLQTVHRERQRPRGEVQTFQSKQLAPQETEAVPIDTDDFGSLLIRFRGGARGVLHVSQTTAGRKNCLRYELAAERAALAWNSETPNELWIGQRAEANRQLMRDPALLGADAASAADYPGGHNEGYADSFKQCFRRFYQYIAAGDFTAPATFPTFADGHREIVLCEAVLRSAREGRWVQLAGDA